MVAILAFILVCPAVLAQQLPDHDVINLSPEKNYLLASKAMGKSDFTQAILHLDAAIRKRKNYPEALLMRAIAHEHLEELLPSLTDYNAIIFLQPEHPEAIYGRARIRFKLEQYAAALEDFRYILHMPIGETQTIFYKQDMTGGGVVQVATMSTMEADIHNYIGLCQLRMGLLDSALETYDAAITKYGLYPDYHINRGQVHEKMGSWEMAAFDYQKALELDPGNAIAIRNLTRLISIYSDSGMAAEQYSNLIRNNPEFAQAYHDRALHYFSQGQFKKALSDFDSAVFYAEHDPDLLLNRGLTYLKLGRPNRALDDFDQCLILNPRHAKGHHGRGNALLKLRQYDDAINSFSLAIHYSEDYGIAYYNRGVALLYLEKNDAACTDLRKAEALGVSDATVLLKKKCN